ncbi:MAG TPA: family 65 glycosyl hydrolase, partial [Streptosporangiaceae bacterium]|nr:family 65 glycosyl hydrolase [Streptosporangiaceae bacterium]
MIKQSCFAVEPWSLRETDLDLGCLAQSESVFALSNGHVGWRANLDEGEPHGLPGSYLNGFYEQRPLPYAEAIYGLPESSQTVLNVTNGKLIRLFVDDEPFDVRYGELRSHERVLDFRDGVLRRNVEWIAPTGRGVRVTSTRMVSFTQRAVAAISYEVTPLDSEVRVAIQSELLTNEELPQASGDPRVAAALEHPLENEYFSNNGTAAVLVHKTKRSGLRVGAAMDHMIDGPPGVLVESHTIPDTGIVTATTPLKPGERLRIVKFVAYGWSGQR